MILKTVRKNIYEIKNSTDKESYLETNYFSNIHYISKNLPLDNKNMKTEDIKLCFRDGKEVILILRTFSNNVWEDNYENVFLMNDDGKTIERLV